MMKIDGSRLREIRLAKFMDIKEVAEASGMNAWTISKIEHDAWPSGSRPSTVRKLAEALGVDPQTLLEKPRSQTPSV